MNWVLLITFFIGLAYAGVLLAIRYGFKKIRSTPSASSQSSGDKFSVIIAARNEAGNIQNVLADLSRQSIGKEAFEVIVVDDHSQDETATLANAYAKKLPLRLIGLKDKSGKGEALKTGAADADGSCLVFTDADVRLHPDWLSGISHHFLSGADWVSGLVKTEISGSFLSIFQAYDQASLMAITGASFALNKPGLASGANLALRKDAYNHIKGYSWPPLESSGDDIMLLEKVVATQSYRLTFSKLKSTTVSTAAAANWRAFLEQRKRWATNSLHVKSSFVKWVMGTGVLANIWLLFLIITAVNNPSYTLTLLAFFILKAVFEAVAIYPSLRAMEQHHWFYFRFPLVALIHPFYIFTAAILGIFAPHNWKGRIKR